MIWNKKQAIEYIDKLDDDSIIEVTKKQTKSIRTYAQNKYYFWVILKYICEHIWIMHKFEVMEQHKQIKDYFWLETTTDLSTDEFAFMCKAIIELFKTNYWVIIPTPSSVEDLRSLETYLF